MFSDFFKGRRILITGHTGFKGGWLALWLKSLEADVFGYALEPHTEPSLFEALFLGQKIPTCFGDICSEFLLKQYLQDIQPEIVFHLAAQALVKTSYENPIDTITTNITGTANLLDQCRKCHSVQAIIVVTTDKCYEEIPGIGAYSETDPLGGHDLYSSSKACAEILAGSFRKSFQMNIATARAGNVIGGGDWSPYRIIPDCIRSLQSGEQLQLRFPNAIRPWQHVLDPLCGYLLLAKKLLEEGKVAQGAWNFGPDEFEVKSVEWLVEQFTSGWEKDVRWKSVSESQLHEAAYLMLDCSKSKKQLNWKPNWNMSQSIQLTRAWYQAFYQKEDMMAFSINQIRRFEEDLASHAVSVLS